MSNSASIVKNNDVQQFDSSFSLPLTAHRFLSVASAFSPSAHLRRVNQLTCVSIVDANLDDERG